MKYGPVGNPAFPTASRTNTTGIYFCFNFDPKSGVPSDSYNPAVVKYLEIIE